MTTPTFIEAPQIERPEVSQSVTAGNWRSEMIVILGLFAVLVYAVTTSSMLFTGGKHVYPLDDTYIGMAVAKNVAAHGVWGITQYEFTSVISSPLFILLLAGCFKLTGPNDWWPMVLASLFAGAALVIANWALADVKPWIRRSTVGALAVLAPLNVLAVLGMEHTLHVALSLLFLHWGAQAACGTRRVDWKLLAVTAAMVGTRYEGLFAAGLVCAALLVWKRKPVEFLLVGGAAALPVVLFGLISTSHGYYWLPNSVLMKGASVDGGVAVRLIQQLQSAPWVAGLLLILVLGAVGLARRGREYPLVVVLIALLSGLAHLALARVGWMFRYEAYVLAMAMFAVAVLTRERLPRERLIYRGVLPAALILLVGRLAWAMTLMPVSAGSIYWQQYQTAHFLAKYYPKASVAANDIGAINYFADLKCLDLVGLANLDVLKAKRAGRYTTEAIDAEAKKYGVTIAVVYDDWFGQDQSEFGGPKLPPQWVRAGRWKIPNIGLVGGDTVAFYAVDPAAEPELEKNLAAYAKELPPLVTVLPAK